MSAFPSLTPNEDAVRASLSLRVDEPADPLTARRRRVSQAIGDARGIAQAMEYDRGASINEFLDAYVIALGLDVVAVANCLGAEEAPHLLSSLLLRILESARSLSDAGSRALKNVSATPMARS